MPGKCRRDSNAVVSLALVLALVLVAGQAAFAADTITIMAHWGAGRPAESTRSAGRC